MMQSGDEEEEHRMENVEEELWARSPKVLRK